MQLSDSKFNMIAICLYNFLRQNPSFPQLKVKKISFVLEKKRIINNFIQGFFK